MFTEGMSETRIGSYLAKQGNQAKDLFTIATKAGITADAEGKRSYDNSLKHIETELEESHLKGLALIKWSSSTFIEETQRQKLRKWRLRLLRWLNPGR